MLCVDTGGWMGPKTEGLYNGTKGTLIEPYLYFRLII